MRIIKLILIVFAFSVVSVHYPNAMIGSAEAKTHKAHSGGKNKKRLSKSVNPGNVWERIRAGIRIPIPSPAAGLENITVAMSNPKNSTPVTSSQVISSLDSPVQEAAPERVATRIKLPNSDANFSEKPRVRQVLMPHKSDAAVSKESDLASKYTAKGRLLLGAKSDVQLTDQLTKKVPLSPAEKQANAKTDLEFKSSLGRIRTRLGLHPDLTKNSALKEGNTAISAQSKTLSSGDKPMVIPQGTIKSCSDLRKKEVIALAKEGFLTTEYMQQAEQCRNKQIAINERVAKQLAAYSRGFLYDVSERARPYLYHIVDKLSKHGLPLDLALLPIMESAYRSTALSPASASGLWQFIPSTGRLYGLQQTSVYDARRDVVASTEAAVHFLASLNAHYRGDWLLALAAYNWGPGNVDAAIAHNQEQGLDSDYWSLEMPAETQNYVPRLLALARIFSNPSGFGLNLRPLRNEPYFIKVTIDRESDIDQLVNKDLNAVAKLANFESDEFAQLNSAYLNPVLPENKPFTFLMPIGNANVLHQSLTFLAKSNNNENRTLPYPHAWGLSSGPLKSKFEIPLLAIDLINEDQKQFSLANVKPNIDNKAITDAGKSTSIGEDPMTVHYLDKGETLKSLAEYHGMSEEKLREVNKIKKKQNVSLGQRLLIPVHPTYGISLKSVTPSVLYKTL